LAAPVSDNELAESKQGECALFFAPSTLCTNFPIEKKALTALQESIAALNKGWTGLSAKLKTVTEKKNEIQAAEKKTTETLKVFFWIVSCYI